MPKSWRWVDGQAPRMSKKHEHVTSFQLSPWLSCVEGALGRAATASVR